MIPVNEPIISEQSKKNVLDALQSGWISSAGKYVEEFEVKFAKYLGVKHAIAVCNGTAALHVSLLSLGIGPGDEVIVPAFTMASTWLSIIYTGAKPIFVDCEIDTYNIDVSKIEEKISNRTKAILPVHIYGHPADMDGIIRIAKKHGLFVIEDAAEAHGAEYKEKKSGGIGDVNCFSFYGNKIITTGEGGIVVTNSDNFAYEARKYKDLYHSDKKRFIHQKIGYNYRMTNLQAAIGCGEIDSIDKYIDKKIKMANQYASQLQNIPGVILPQTKTNVKNVYWMYAIRVDKKITKIDRDTLRQKLKEKDIDTRDFFYPPTEQPFLKPYLSPKDNFPISVKISQEGLYLPSGLAISEDQISQVCETIKSIIL